MHICGAPWYLLAHGRRCVPHAHVEGVWGGSGPHTPRGSARPVLPRPISGFGVRFLSVHKCLYQSPCVVSKTPGPQPPPLAPDSEQTVKSRRLDTPSSSRRPVPEWEQGVTTTKRQTVFCSLEPSRQRSKGIGPGPAEREVSGDPSPTGAGGDSLHACAAQQGWCADKRVISVRVRFVTWAQLHTPMKTEAEAGQGQIMRGSPSKLGEPRQTWVYF